MLNSIKKIQNKANTKKIDFFWKIPFPTSSRFQMKLNLDSMFLGGLPVVLAQHTIKKKKWWIKVRKRRKLKHLKLRFFFNSIIFNSIFLFKKCRKLKKRRLGLWKLKKNLLLLQYIFQKTKSFKGYLLTKNKGGFFSTVLGFRSFMPKSHSKLMLKNRPPLVYVIGLKICQRRKRFSSFKKTTLNIISSSKPQQGSLKIKNGTSVKSKRHYWRNIAKLVKKK